MQRFGDVSQEIKRVRKQMEEDEQLASLMRGLRGSNLRDDQFADKDVTMRLVEVPLIPFPTSTPNPFPSINSLPPVYTVPHSSTPPMEFDSLISSFTI
jgi:hypothetical protein